MQHITPSENPNTPKDLQNHIDAVRNRISVHESEVKRLQSLVVASQYTIDQQVVQKKDLEENTDRLTREKGQLEKEIIILTEKKEEVLKEKKSIEDDIQKAVKEFGRQAQEINEKGVEIKDREATLTVNEKAYETRLEKLVHQESLHKARVAKLTQALE